MDLAGKVVLVTGGTGFIGSRLVEKLVVEQHAHVRVLVRNFARAARISRFPVEMLGGNITDRESIKRAVDGCDVVFHCAYNFDGNAAEQKSVGLKATVELADAVISNKVSTMVYVSSFAVYAPTADGDLTESSPWPTSRDIYVEIKRSSERELMERHRRHGLPVSVIQPSLVYGPYSPHWTIDPVNKLTTGIVPLVENGTGSCNAVYIDDVVDALILAATRPKAVGETFLISSEEPLTWKEFYGAYENIIGKYSTAPMMVSELLKLREIEQKQSSLFRRLKSLAMTPEVFPLLASVPPIPTAVRTVQRLLSDKQWQYLKARMGQENGAHYHKVGRAERIHVPDTALLSLYRSKTCVCIEKAKNLLGYSPRFNFARGMDITAQYIHWANLGPQAIRIS